MNKLFITLTLLALFAATAFSQTVYRYDITATDDVDGDQIEIGFNADPSGQIHSIQFNWDNLYIGPTWVYNPGPIWAIAKVDSSYNYLLNRVEFGTYSSIDTDLPFQYALLNGNFYFDWQSVVDRLTDMGFSVTVTQLPNCFCGPANTVGNGKGHRK